MGRLQYAGTLENAEYPFIAITPRSTLARSGSTWQGLIFGLNRNKLYTVLNRIVWNRNIFDILTVLNWIVWNRTIFTFKLCTYVNLNCFKWNCFWYLNCSYAKLNCLKKNCSRHWNCVLMLNWIVWNRTVYMYQRDLALNNLQWLICHKTKPNQTWLFKNVIYKMCLWIIYILYICINRIWHWINYKGWYAINPNQTKNKECLRHE